MSRVFDFCNKNCCTIFLSYENELSSCNNILENIDSIKLNIV